MISMLSDETLFSMLSSSIRAAGPRGSDLRFDSGMGNFGRYASIIQRLDTFREILAEKDGRVVLAVSPDQAIVGYVACWHPASAERWSKLGDLIYEMGAIEVSRRFRGRGIARRMIATVLSEDFFEDKIACVSSFSWHWDLDGSTLAAPAYRQMLAGLMETYGFLEHYTNEPNLTIKKENLFMARIGSRISARDKKRFQNLRYGVADT